MYSALSTLNTTTEESTHGCPLLRVCVHGVCVCSLLCVCTLDRLNGLYIIQNSSKQICGWILMWETTGDALFHWRKRYYGLWTCILARSESIKLKTSWWICFSFCLLKTLTDGLEWCGLLVDYCDVFISCLDSHSDGTHSLQRIHWWASDVMLHFSKSDEETNSSTSWMTWGWVNFKQIFYFLY